MEAYDKFSVYFSFMPQLKPGWPPNTWSHCSPFKNKLVYSSHPRFLKQLKHSLNFSLPVLEHCSSVTVQAKLLHPLKFKKMYPYLPSFKLPPFCHFSGKSILLYISWRDLTHSVYLLSISFFSILLEDFHIQAGVLSNSLVTLLDFQIQSLLLLCFNVHSQGSTLEITIWKFPSPGILISYNPFIHIISFPSSFLKFLLPSILSLWLNWVH